MGHNLSLGPSLLGQILAGTILFAHIGAGIVSLTSGATAMAAPKGGRTHVIAGKVFVVAMLVMAGIGAVISPLLPERANVVPGVFTAYLVATAWMTVRRPAGTTGPFEIVALLVAFATAAMGVTLGLQAVASPDGLLDAAPASNYFVFAAFPVLAGLLDLRVILRGGSSGAGRLARHLWRMSFALFIAAGSLFLGQQKVFPVALRGSSVMLAPEFAVLGAMVFWLLHVRLPRCLRPHRPPPSRTIGETHA